MRRRACTRSRVARCAAAALTAALTVGVGGAAAHGPTHVRTAKASRLGTSTEAVQRALGIRADGVFGPRTRRAVKRFQRAHGLAVDGVVGPATLAALGLTAKRPSAAPASLAVPTVLQAIARCESGGNPAAVSSSGTYRGKYQFSRETWAALGGSGDPAAASETEQDRRAAALYASAGTSPWPSCGAAL